MHNAIDADASELRVRVDLGRFWLQVVDNGRGIDAVDLEVLGDRYTTSKCRRLSDLDRLRHLGYRGEALASLIDTSNMLQIVSKRRGKDAFAVSFFKGRRGKVEKYLRQFDSPSGTVVNVSDFLYNMPVRRKSVSSTLDLAEIRESIVAQALNQTNVSFVLIDDSRREEILNTGGKSLDSIAAFSRCFGNKQQFNRKNLLAVDAEDEKFALSGFIASEGAPNNTKQFLFVNGRHMRRTKLHKIVSDKLLKSSMCRPVKAPTVSTSASPAKTSKRFPIFFLRLSCPLAEYDICLEPRKTQIEFRDWKFVEEFLGDAIRKFLVDNRLYPPEELLRIDNEREEFEHQKETDSPNSSGLELLHDVSDSDASEVDEASNFVQVRSNEAEEPKIDCGGIVTNPLDNIEGARQGKVKTRKRPTTMATTPPEASKQSKTIPDGWIEKVSKATGETCYVHVASGSTATSLDKCRATKISKKLAQYRVSSASSILPAGKTPFLPGIHKVRVKSKSSSSESEKSKSSVANGILEKWKNPVFELPMIIARLSAPTASSATIKFDKRIFADILVIGQVDRKFIAATVNVPSVDSRVFVLFDQHAVHERIRLETLQEENFPFNANVDSETIEPSLAVDISTEDRHLINRYLEQVRKFGVTFDDSGDVNRVPKCFLRREAVEIKYDRPSPLPHLVSSLLRDVAENLRTTRGASTSVLPKTIHDTLCSQSCRSAVKFGDILSAERCRRMLKDLGKCNAPFQCAHGRPDIAPIVPMQSLSSGDEPKATKFNLTNLVDKMKRRRENRLLMNS